MKSNLIQAQYALAERVINEADLHCHHGPSLLWRLLENFDDELISECMKAGAGEEFLSVVREARQVVRAPNDNSCEDCEAVALQKEWWNHIRQHGELWKDDSTSESVTPAHEPDLSKQEALDEARTMLANAVNEKEAAVLYAENALETAADAIKAVLQLPQSQVGRHLIEIEKRLRSLISK